MIRVLVVEDDPVMAEGHRRFVERVDGFVVSGVAGTGGAAIEHLEEYPVDLVLLDVRLPDTDGITVCREMRRRGYPVDVIAVTSTRDTDVVRAAVSLGVVQYLIKPFDFAVFREKLVRYRQYRHELGRHGDRAAAQEDVDRALAALRSPSVEAQPKGLSPDTAALVLDGLRTVDDASAAELAIKLGISRVTARRYLERLAEQGLATRTLRYGTSGRPQQRYRWAPIG